VRREKVKLLQLKAHPLKALLQKALPQKVLPQKARLLLPPQKAHLQLMVRLRQEM
jgi:hypothetical protein